MATTPLNGPTTLTVKGSNDEDVTIDFPIPAGKVTLQKYNLTINYKYADGTEAKPTHTESLTYGSSYSVASPLITGYTADKLTVSGSMPDSDVTVDVTFTAKDYTVTYESNGGSTVPSQTVKYNETANKPADPTRSGYTFAGWYTEEKLTNKYDFATPETSCQGLFNQIHKKATKKVPGSTFMLLTLRQAGHLRPLNSSSQRYAYSGNWSI